VLNKIIHFSLYNRLIILTGGLLLLIAGLWISTRMDIDIFPDLSAPTVVVMTEAHGMAPEEVERLVSFPIESAVNGSTGIRRVRSASSMGFSIVWVEFKWGTNIYNARQIVSEKLISIKDKLPQGVGSPTLAPQSSLLGEVMIFAMTSDSTDPMKLRTLAEWTIRPQLLSVPGVAQITIIGGDFKEYQILIDPILLKNYGVSLDEVIETCNLFNENASGGFINEYGNRYAIRGIGRAISTEEIGNTVIRSVNDYPVLLKDISKVTIGSAPKIGEGSYRGKKAVIVTVNKQPGINTIKLTELLHDKIGEIRADLPPDVKINTDIFEQASFINIAIENVRKAILEGGIFVVIILMLFLMNVRTTFISLVAIPLSLIVSIIALEVLGFTINTMSLGGMAIAIGSLVDDAIIDVENVYKRLKENAIKEVDNREPILKVIYNASKEIRASILNATLIIIVAFMPLFFLSGMEGKMLKPLGIAYIVSLFASLIVAITITPVLCSYLLTSNRMLKSQLKGSWLTRHLSTLYNKSLIVVLRHKKIVIGMAILLFAGALYVFLSFGRSFLPPFNEGSLAINTATLPGITLEESNRLGSQAELALLEIPEITTTSRKTGRTELAEHSFGVNVSEIETPFVLKDRSRQEFLNDVRTRLNNIQGIIVEVGQPISHRIDHMLSGTRSNIAIKLFGTDLKKMYRYGQEIRSSIEDIDGIADLAVEQQVEIPQIQIKPDRLMLARYGIPLNHFIHFIEYALGGVKVSTVFEDEMAFDLVVRYDNQYRDNMEAIREVLIDAEGGSKIPLHYVADIRSTTGPNSINRENLRRKLVISANVEGKDLRSVVNDIKQHIEADISLPENYYIEYGGQFESEERASRILLFASLMAILIIYLILYQEFKENRIAGIILLNLPLALIGGVASIWLTSGIISIPAIIGFITLFGIATRNGILLVSRYEHLKEEGLSIYDTVIKGSLDRLNPILMTALTASLALIPLAIAGDKPGNEIQSPMAVVILGGLLTSTLLNIYVIPVIYILSKSRSKRNEK